MRKNLSVCTPYPKWNRAEQEFRVWSESTYSDYMGEMNFFSLQKLAYYSQKTSGDCFALLPYDPRPGAPYDLRVQLIEADRVCNKDDAGDTDEIAGGIERDKDGKPVAIYIRTPHPGATYFSMLNTMPTWKRVPIFGARTGRRNIIHLKDVDRIGQSRGVPVLTPIIETLKQIGRYSEAELAAAVVNSMLSVFVKRPIEGPSGMELHWLDEYEKRGEAPPWENPLRFKLGNGTWIDGAPGEDLNVITAARPSSQFDPFQTAMIKQIGMALRLPMEILIQLFQSSYSASKAAFLAAQKTFEAERDAFDFYFNQPIWEAWITEAVIKERLSAPGYLTNPAIRFYYSGAYWQTSEQNQIDETKEATAANLRVEYGFSTRAREAAKLTGMSYADIVAAQAKEKELAAKSGLLHGTAKPAKADV